MPTQKESQAAGLPPMINLGLSAEDAPNNQLCKTNPICHPNNQKMQNEPNLPHHHRHHYPTMRNEPNFHLGEPVEDQKIRNEPNLSTAGPPIIRNEPNPSTFQANPAGRKSVPARRETQFTSTATIPLASPCPNMQNEPNFSRRGPVEDQKMQNEPNSRPFQANHAGQRSVPARRGTQFTPTATRPHAKNAKRTQSPPRCHPERRAAQRNTAAQSRGNRSITIAGGDSTQTRGNKVAIFNAELYRLKGCNMEIVMSP